MKIIPTLDWTSQLPWLIPVILVAFFGVIVLIVIIVKKKTTIFGKDEGPKSEEEIAEEELTRILQPIEDDKVAAEVQKFDQAEAIKDESAEGEEVIGEDKPIE